MFAPGTWFANPYEYYFKKWFANSLVHSCNICRRRGCQLFVVSILVMLFIRDVVPISLSTILTKTFDKDMVAISPIRFSDNVRWGCGCHLNISKITTEKCNKLLKYFFFVYFKHLLKHLFRILSFIYINY